MMVFCFTYNSPSEIEPHTKEAHHLITESSLLTEQHILYIDLALLSLNYVLLLFAAHTEMPKFNPKCQQISKANTLKERISCGCSSLNC